MYFFGELALCEYNGEMTILSHAGSISKGRSQNDRQDSGSVNSVIRVLVVADDSLLADGIVSILDQEAGLEVIRLTSLEPGSIKRAIHEYRFEVIIVEEGVIEDEWITERDWARDRDHIRVITISPKHRQLRIWESYLLPNLGAAQLVDLVRELGSR
jgi:hypothetical protein